MKHLSYPRQNFYSILALNLSRQYFFWPSDDAFITGASNDVILAELKVMKKLESHENICNLLAYCTIGRSIRHSEISN